MDIRTVSATTCVGNRSFQKGPEKHLVQGELRTKGERRQLVSRQRTVIVIKRKKVLK